MKKNNIINITKTLILALVLAAGVSYISAWTGATTAAPTGNVSAPVNVGSLTQTKLGGLFLNTSSTPVPIGLEVFGQSIFNGKIQIADGTQGVGKVLTSDASGTATWVAPGAPTAPSSATITVTTPGTYVWTVPAGVTSISAKVWGAGGAGGGYTTSSGGFNGGGGGSGAYSANSSLTVSPGDSFIVTVGAGANRGAGGNSAIASIKGINLTAGGGYPGGDDSANTIPNQGTGYGVGGAGGTASGGSVNTNGNAGVDCSTYSCGSGGAGASAPNGGAGGAAGYNYAGGAPGGGGGGAGNGYRGQPGGAGGNGEVIISY